MKKTITVQPPAVQLTFEVKQASDRTYKIIKWGTIIAIPIIIAIAYYVSTHSQIGNVLG